MKADVIYPHEVRLYHVYHSCCRSQSWVATGILFFFIRCVWSCLIHIFVPKQSQLFGNSDPIPSQLAMFAMSSFNSSAIALSSAHTGRARISPDGMSCRRWRSTAGLTWNHDYSYSEMEDKELTCAFLICDDVRMWWCDDVMIYDIWYMIYDIWCLKS